MTITETKKASVTAQSQRSRARRWGGAVAVTVLGLGVAVFLRKRDPTEEVRAASAPTEVSVGTASFPEQAQSDAYRSAVGAGEANSVAVIEDALRQATAQVPVDTAVVKRLGAELARRKARLRELGL